MELWNSIVRTMDCLSVPDNWTTLDRCDVLLVCHDNSRNITLNNQAYSPHLDSLGDDLSSRGIVCGRIARPYSTVVGNKAYGSPVSLNRRWFRETAWGSICHRFVKILWNRSNLDKVHNEKASKVFIEILKKTKCRCVIGISLPKSMYKAARQLHIPAIEILHGIGYQTIPWGWDKRGIEYLPNLVLSLDPVSTKTFSRLIDKGLCVKEILHPFHKRFLISTEQKKLPEEWKKSIQISNSFRKKVLISLQWGYDNDHPDFAGILRNGIISDKLLNVIKHTQDSIFWLIRLHPRQLRNFRYRRHRTFIETFVRQVKNCEMYLSSTLPLPSLLINCDGHVTMDSMTSYDAAYYGVPTLLLCPSLQNGGVGELLFHDLLELGMAELGGFDEKNIRLWVEKAKSVKPLMQVSDNSNWDEVVELLLGEKT